MSTDGVLIHVLSYGQGNSMAKRKIDILGNGEYIYQKDKLPSVLTLKCGCRLSRTEGLGIGYIHNHLCAKHEIVSRQEAKEAQKRRRYELQKQLVALRPQLVEANYRGYTELANSIEAQIKTTEKDLKRPK